MRDLSKIRLPRKDNSGTESFKRTSSLFLWYTRGEYTDRFNSDNWGQMDFFNLSQCDYIISSPSTFCITAAMCGRKNKKIIHSKEWVVDYKLKTDYFRDIFWKTLHNTGGDEDYKLYKLI